MRLHPLRPTLLCLALFTASGHALASEYRPSPSDDACPENGSTSITERTSDGLVDDPAMPARQTQKAKPAMPATPRATGGARSTPPRYHSFLPGMFR